jgi:hypothetical protein
VVLDEPVVQVEPVALDQPVIQVEPVVLVELVAADELVTLDQPVVLGRWPSMSPWSLSAGRRILRAANDHQVFALAKAWPARQFACVIYVAGLEVPLCNIVGRPRAA